MTPSHRHLHNIDTLDANHRMVSVSKYGFFLCRKGKAKILLGSNTYLIARNHLCVYAPNVFFRILERSQDLEGLLDEGDIDVYHPVLSLIPIRKRLEVRRRPVCQISEEQAEALTRLYAMMDEGEPETDLCKTPAGPIREAYVRHLRYALCLKVLETCVLGQATEAMAQDRGDVTLSRFLVSLYDHGHEQRTVQFYAAEQHLSPYYFSCIIKERSGLSASGWIAGVTMSFARQYLENSQMSIKEIAHRLGFPDQSAFGRYFKQREGCSPTIYREKKNIITDISTIQ